MGAAPQISPNERVAEFRKTFARAEAEVARVIVGHREAIRKVLTALFCGGHILIEGVPGLGKTLGRLTGGYSPYQSGQEKEFH